VFKLNFGVLGLALALTLTNFVQALLLFIFLDKKIGLLYNKEVFNPVLKMSFITFLAGLFLWWPMRFLDKYILDTTKTTNLIFLVLLTLVLSIIVYLVLSLIFKVRQLQNLTLVLKRFGQWKQILSQSEEILDER